MLKMYKFIIIALAVCLPIFSQEIIEEDIQHDDQVISKKFDQAVESFKAGELDSALQSFNDLIIILKTDISDNVISDSKSNYLEKSYEFRALIFFKKNDLENCKRDILSILDGEIEYNPANDLPVKFRSYVNRLKQENIGYLKVSTQPPGAIVIIENRRYESLANPRIKHRTGSYIARITKEGYADEEREVIIIPQKETRLAIDLRRTSAVLSLMTSPPDAVCYLNGEEKGKSEPITFEEAKKAFPELDTFPDKIGKVVIANVEFGRYKLEIKKPCFQGIVFNIDVQKPEDYNLGFFMMDASQGNIEIHNVEDDAEVYINGQASGRGNVKLNGLCSGFYTLVVKYSDGGKYLKQFTLKKDETVHVEPSRKATVLFGGVLDGKGGNPCSHPLVPVLSEALNNLKSINVLTLPEAETAALEYGEKINRFTNISSKPFEPVIIDHSLNAWKDALLAKYESDLLLVFIEQPDSGLTLLLMHKSHNKADNDFFPLSEDEITAQDITDRLQKLDALPVLQRTWIGFSPIDYFKGNGVMVVDLLQESPAAKAGIKEGDIIRFFNGRRIAYSRILIEELQKLEPGASVSIKVERGGKILDLAITISWETVLPEDTNDFYNNRIIEELNSGMHYKNISEKEFTIFLIKGILYYYSGSYQIAREYLERALQNGSMSIDPFLIKLFIGLSSEKMGDTASADRQKNEIKKYPDIRLYSKNGIPLYLIDKYDIYP
ncbi:MAG: PEGA domain-containing protein [Acidobacteria bacterium]|nr:PEGA domain-containing protein [Acidobacteriota bacterium]